MRFSYLWALFALTCLVTTPTRADELRPGYLELTQKSPSVWHMVWKAPIKGGLATNVRPDLPKSCKASLPHRELVAAAVVSVSEVRCSAPLAGQHVGLTGLDASFTDALVRIAPLGRPVQAARLTADAPITQVQVRADRSQVAATYFRLGVEHILTGYDHLLFVLSLVLLLAGGWKIAKTVTAFTVAHSLTLIGTTLHLVSVQRQPVEICIALKSILTCWFRGGDLNAEIAEQGIACFYAPLSWHCLLAGYGTFPDDARLTPPGADIETFDLTRIDEFMERAARGFGDHKALLDQMSI